VENAYTHTWMAYLQFHNFRSPQCPLVAQMVLQMAMAFQAEVPPVLVKVRWFLQPSACLLILFCTILAWKVAGRMLFINYCRVSFHRSLHLLMPRKLNSSLFLFSDFGARFLDQLLRFHYSSARKPSFGHFRYIQGKVHVGLFQRYPTSLPRHNSRHVENLQEIGCCF